MRAHEASNASPPRKAGIPRRLVFVLSPLVFLVAIPLAHGVVPWALSLLGPWYGWADGSPAVWNLLGLVPVAIGIMVLLWLMIVGCTQIGQLPERVEVNWDPKILMTRGPYAYSRHPMYLAELGLWLGWAVLYGSVIVLAGFVVLGVVVSILAPREERALEAKFGEAYCQYRARVPRWLGVPREGSDTGRTNGRS
jgi:protein-S-isoprenylcysteine O-methyltransferase Ste14